MSQLPVLWWVRRDLRLADNPALSAAIAAGGPVIPVFIRDAVVTGTGAAARWRWGEGLKAFDAALRDRGSRLVFRSGNPRDVLEALARETGARAVHWSRLHDPASIARDTDVKSALKAAGLEVKSHPGHLLFEPWTVETGEGGFYKVYSPYWRAVKDREVGPCLAAPARLSAPEDWPESERLEDWALGRDMHRGAAIVEKYACVGEGAAQRRLARFLDGPIEAYKKLRDFPAEEATSRHSENLTYGEISPRQLLHAGWAAARGGAAGGEHFVKEVVWREFAWHLLYHRPDLAEANFRPEWDAFPWRDDNAQAEAWRRARTGCEIVDAAMRELWVTGTMHNRCRMLVASYLTKHLLTHWRVGLAWFEDTLIDWDPASNAMGWQWVAGSGPDAAPYFRIFNPETQAEKFDPDRRYRDRFLRGAKDRQGRSPTDDWFAAIPRSWGQSPDDPPPPPLVDLAEGRKRALEAYEALKSARE